MRSYLVFDIESQRLVSDWSRPWEAGLSVAVTWCVDGGYSIWTEDDLEGLANELARHPLIVSYNGKHYDMPALRGMSDAFACVEGKPHYDIFEILVDAMPDRRWPSADEVARVNGIRGKTGLGAKAPQLYQEGRTAELWSYCINDVTLERDLFELSQRQGYLLCPVQKHARELVKVEMPKAEEVAYAF